MTIDFEKRIKQHNAGYTKSTKAYRPWKKVLIEEFNDSYSARLREKYLKSGIGREYIKYIWTRSITE